MGYQYYKQWKNILDKSSNKKFINLLNLRLEGILIRIQILQSLLKV